jgi:ATP-binding cassette subfamily F protein 3
MLTIDGVTVRLGGRAILESASATVPVGARVGLIGRNGAGKSTLMKALIGELEPDAGAITKPSRARIGYIAQEAPSGTMTPEEVVLASATERAQLLEELETCTDMDRMGDVHDRLLAIDAYSAPARAAKILNGLGFDEAMQQRPVESFSGGWKMRIALGALLFSEPDILLLDEPSNHFDLEATLWLENFLKSYPATLVVISHERDLLNKVVDHILHLQGGQLTLYSGGYDAFEKQRAERAAQLAAAKASQDAQRARLQDYVARNSARASTAKQAQSRAKMLARMQPIAALMEDPSLSFDFPDPEELRSPMITLDQAAVGYGDAPPILRRLNFRIEADDRIALLGRNGNGKTTLARLLASQLTPAEGEVNAPGRLKVGYFTQYQVEELAGEDTPLDLMNRAMDGQAQGAVRGQLGRFGFSGSRAQTRVDKLSGGERARLALALITRDAPHLLILDEPTNHLDVDAREALVQALNGYSGAVILISHDRHMVELTADRLVLVHDGTANEYNGSMEDYIDFVLGRNQPKGNGGGKDRKSRRSGGANAEAQARSARSDLAAAEKSVTQQTAELEKLDRAIVAGSSADAGRNGAKMQSLLTARAETAYALQKAEEAWLAAGAALEAIDRR